MNLLEKMNAHNEEDALEAIMEVARILLHGDYQFPDNTREEIGEVILDCIGRAQQNRYISQYNLNLIEEWLEEATEGGTYE